MCVVAPLFGIALLSFEVQKEYMYVNPLLLLLGDFGLVWLGLVEARFCPIYERKF